MQFHGLKYFFIIVYFTLTSVAKASSEVKSEYEMLLPRSFQQNLIERVWQNLQRDEFHFAWSLPEQIYDTPDVKVLLSGLHLDVRTKLQRPALGSEGDHVLLESRDLEANLILDSVSIDQYIEREVGGVIGRFRIQAKCENVGLHMKPGKAVLTMKLSPVFNGTLLSASVDDANLTWTSDAWEITSLQCTGATGFDDIIKSEIEKLTGDASIVTKQKAELMELVRQYVSTKKIDLTATRTLVTSRPDIQVTMNVSDFSSTDKNAVILGDIRVLFKKARSQKNIQLQLTPGGIGASESPVIRIPEDFVLAVAKQAYEANSWVERVSSDKIPGFSTLMDSRLTQFFVWRELLHFSKTTKFIFDIFSPKNISINGQALNYKLSGVLGAKMYAAKSGKYIPFMDFSIPLSSHVSLSLNDGKVTAKFNKLDIDIHEEWNPSYVEKYHPSRKFAADKIKSRILESAQGASLSYVLPAVSVSDEISLILKKMQPIKNNELLLYLSGFGVFPESLVIH